MKKITTSIFLFLLLLSQFSLSAPNSVVAVVGHNVITVFDLKSVLNNPAKIIDKKVLMDALNEKIERIVQKQEAKKIGIQIRSESLQKKIKQLAKNNNLSIADLRQLPNYDELVERLSDQILINGLFSIKTRDSTTMIAPEEFKLLHQQYLDDNTQYHIHNIIVENQAEADVVQTKIDEGKKFQQLATIYSKAMNAPDGGNLGFGDLSSFPKYYIKAIKDLSLGKTSPVIFQEEDNLYHFVHLVDTKTKSGPILEEVKIKHIFIKKQEETIDALLKNIQTTKPLDKILNLYIKLKNGVNFSDLAKIHSQGDYANQGGELPWINIKKLPPKGQKVFNILEDLEVSTPFESEAGWHIIQRIDHRIKNLVKDKIRLIALNKIRLTEYKKWLQTIKEKTYIVIHHKKIDQMILDGKK